MSIKSAVNPNINNRSPSHVQSQPLLDAQFSFSARHKAHDYRESIQAQGRGAKLIQLETSFLLRLRRKGVKAQALAFDTFKEA